MNAELSLLKLLSDIATDNSFVVTPDRRDQVESNVSAYVTTQLISAEGNVALSGDMDLDHSRVQVTVFSPTKRDCIRVAKAIRGHCSGFRGELTITDFGKVFVSDCLHAGTRAIYDPPSDGSQAGDYTLAIDFLLSASV